MDLNEITELEACEKEETDEEDFLESEALGAILESDAPMRAFYEYAEQNRLNAQALLQSRCRLDLMVDTGDGWGDFEFNTLAPSWAGRHLGHGYRLEDEASIVWLTRRQGYNKGDLGWALHHIEEAESMVKERSLFLWSAAMECWSEHSSMNQLVFLTESTLEEVLLLRSLGAWGTRTELWNGYLLLDRSITAGMFDAFHGSGGSMGIQLERDVKLPMKYLSAARPDTQFQNWMIDYSVNSVYKTDQFWRPGGLKTIHFPKKFRRIMPELGFTPEQTARLIKNHIEKSEDS